MHVSVHGHSSSKKTYEWSTWMNTLSILVYYHSLCGSYNPFPQQPCQPNHFVEIDKTYEFHVWDIKELCKEHAKSRDNNATWHALHIKQHLSTIAYKSISRFHNRLLGEAGLGDLSWSRPGDFSDDLLFREPQGHQSYMHSRRDTHLHTLEWVIDWWRKLKVLCQAINADPTGANTHTHAYRKWFMFSTVHWILRHHIFVLHNCKTLNYYWIFIICTI